MDPRFYDPSADFNTFTPTELTMHAVELPPELESLLEPSQAAATGELRREQMVEFFPDTPTELLSQEKAQEFFPDTPTELLSQEKAQEFFPDTPTELLSPEQHDPLRDAEFLPSLFPHQQEPIRQAPKTPEVPPTIVPRPKRKKRRGWRIVRRIFISIFKWAFALVLAVAVLIGGLVGYLTVTEYSPDQREKADIGNRQVTGTYDGSSILRIVTFNTGYAGLGKDADFFMDGGEGVTPESKETVIDNMIGIERILSDIDADIMLLQEVDTDSKRSYEQDQWRQYEYDLEDYESVFALNYSCDYVPYPIGDFIGKVHSGIATYSRYDIASSTRISLPNSFSWPSRVANLKRCLLVTRFKLAGREQELVIVNCHLEAYDDGEAKQAQTEVLIRFIEKEYLKGNYVIVGGDFNQSFPESEKYPLLNEENWAPGKLDELRRGWQYAYDEKTPTCRLLDQPYDPNEAQYYVIDGFILSPNVQLKRVQTIDEGFVYSDHNPVVLDITLK